MDIRNFPTDFKEDVAQMVEDGLSLQNVANYMGISVHQVRLIAHKDAALKKKARNAVGKALASGRLKKGPCAEKGCTYTDVEAHHPDYTKPFDVVWLCKWHHTNTII